MKIILPESTNNNSIDKHTDEDDQNQCLVDNYDQGMLIHEEILDVNMQRHH